MYHKNEYLDFDDIYPYLVDDDLVIKEIRKQFKNNIVDVVYSIKNTNYLEIDNAYYDFLMDIMDNSARIYTEFTANGDDGNYPIYVRGLGGIYFVDATEFDNVGYFISLNDAEDYVRADFNLSSRSERRYFSPFFKKNSVKLQKIINSNFVVSQKKSRNKINILHSIRKILESPSQCGNYNFIKKIFPSGRSVTFSCSYSTGMGSLVMLQKYRNRFFNIPEWLKLCHPYHCFKICKLALEFSTKLPLKLNNLEKYYIEPIKLKKIKLGKRVLLQSIREILEDPAQHGNYSSIYIFPSGKSVTFYCSWASGMGKLMMLQKYKKKFQTVPEWLKLCHPSHCWRICKIAVENSVKLPDEFNDLEKYYFKY
ncbi:MAG: hypothetical protein EOM37_11340 [Proteobacteria bacterium]|nr:hypothetical protein [Pseudomonadota bacterium]